jgi:hypothetical protein
MQTIWKFILTFIVISISAWLMVHELGFKLGNENYWDHHGLFFLIFISLFPRLTLIFSSVPFGGILWWLGWLFIPRILVAILATIFYWNQNPFLVVCSWLIALSGESGEKYYVTHYSSRSRERPMKRVN